MDCFGTYFTHAQSCDNVRVPSASGHMLNLRVFAFSRFRVFVFGFRVFAFSRFAAGIPGAEPHISYAQINYVLSVFELWLNFQHGNPITNQVSFLWDGICGGLFGGWFDRNTALKFGILKTGEHTGDFFWASEFQISYEMLATGGCPSAASWRGWRNGDAPAIQLQYISFSFFWSPICASIWEIWNLRYSDFGYNQMGADQTGYNQMACNQSCGQVWGSQQRTMALTMKDNKAFCFTMAQRHRWNGWQSKVAEECKGVTNIEIPWDMHRYAISEAKGAGRSPSHCSHWGSLVSGLAVARQRMARSDAPNGPGDNRGFGELCRAQFAGCAVQCEDTDSHWLISQYYKIIVVFLFLPHCTRRLGDKMASRCIWLDMVQDCW